MRRVILAVLLLCAATVGAQDFIRYHPPAGFNAVTKAVALTAGSATPYLTLQIAPLQATVVWVDYALHCADASDVVTYVNSMAWYCLNATGTPACSVAGRMTAAQAGTSGASIGTATNAVAYTANTATFTMTGACTLTETTLNMYFTAYQNNPRLTLF